MGERIIPYMTTPSYSELPADIRDHHPYHMYDEIKSQPAAVARSLTIEERDGQAIHQSLARARRVYVTGCGTSFHAAQAGAAMLRTFTAGNIDARAIQAFEFVTYAPPLAPEDVVIGVTHAGTTLMTLEALALASEQGASAIALTGFPAALPSGFTGQVLATGYGEERSWAHTVSYTAALSSFAAIANRLADPAHRLDLAELPEVMAEVLELEDVCHNLAAAQITAEQYREQAGIVIAGPGSNRATAQEGVLKLLETSYGWTIGWELEQLLHGPLAATSADTLFILLVPPGRSTERAAELARAILAIGAAPVVLLTEEDANQFEDTHRMLLPSIPEVLSPLPYVVPLQLFSYFLAIGKGHNPDLIRRDDEHYRAASAAYR